MAVIGQNCGNCGFSWSHLADQLVSCGAPVDDGALADAVLGRGGGANPVWAERKYGASRILRAMLGGSADEPAGSNPERLSREDGGQCKMWRSKGELE